MSLMPLLIFTVPRRAKKTSEYKTMPKRDASKIYKWPWSKIGITKITKTHTGKRWKKNCSFGKMERMPQTSSSGP